MTAKTDYPEWKFTPAAERWLAALESGEYSQTAGVLRDSKGFCCLGVACHLSRKAKIVDKNKLGFYVYGDAEGDASMGRLPYKVQKELGLYHIDGSPCGLVRVVEGEIISLADLNDKEDYTFAQIADHLRTYPQHYFEKID